MDEGIDTFATETRHTAPETSENSTMCPVCFQELAINEVIVLNCSHQFHKACTAAWLKTHRSCPICRLTAVPAQEGDVSGKLSFEDQTTISISCKRVLACEGHEIVSFSKQNGCLAVCFRHRIEIKNMLSEHYFQSCKTYTTGRHAFAGVYGEYVRIWTYLHQEEHRFSQFLLHKGLQIPIFFTSLQVHGDFLYCISPVQLVILSLINHKSVFQLAFERPLIQASHPFYLFSDGLHILNNDTLCPYRQVDVYKAYLFDFCEGYFAFALLDGNILIVSDDGTTIFQITVGLVKRLLINSNALCLLSDGLPGASDVFLRIYDLKGQLALLQTGVSWVAKDGAGMLFYSIEDCIYVIDAQNGQL